jgi:cytochrome c peroxidase
MSADSSQILCEEALPEGTGGNVVGPDRIAPLNSRNTPSIINSALFPKQMWNGRFAFVDQTSTDVNQLDPALGFSFPSPETLLFTRSLLTAQAHIPVTEAVEMTGDFPYVGQPFPPRSTLNKDIRDTLAAIVSGIQGYRMLFEDAYAPGTSVNPLDPVIGPGDPSRTSRSLMPWRNFEEQDLVMTSAPWDHFLAGDDSALSTAAKQGALIFFGRGKCSTCHSGNLFSDFENHNIGVPVVGPGTAFGDLTDASYMGLTTWDFGAEEVTGRRRDRFKHRTPPLRGVALTSPYMHNGCYMRLEDAIMHHVRPRDAYATYDISQIEPDMQAADGLKPIHPVFDQKMNPVVIGPGTAIVPNITAADVPLVIEFLKSLTDPRMNDTSSLAPAVLPSGLPADVPGPHRFPLYR